MVTDVILPNISNAASAFPIIYTTANRVTRAVANKSSKKDSPLKGDYVSIEHTG